MKTRIFIIVLTLLFAFNVMAAETTPSSVGRDEALSRLMDGNSRYASGHPQAWNAGLDKRTALVGGQHPLACIITCADSRVSPEILFDQSLGDIFVIRNAGNIASQEVIGSVEYAVEHLKVPVVIVLGHTGCGAVAAACKNLEATGALKSVIGRIEPAVAIAHQSGVADDQLFNKVSEINALHTALELIQASSVINEAVSKKETSVMSAIYSLQTGDVTFENEVAGVHVPKSPTRAAATEIHADKPAPAAAAQAQATPAVAPATEKKAETATREEAATPPKKKERSASFSRRFR